MERSIRASLTLWLAGLIAACMAVFGLVLYVVVGGVLAGTLDQTLRVQAQQVAANYDFGGAEGASNGTGQHVDIGAVDQFATAGVFIETFDPRGRPLARSSNLGSRRLPLPAPPAALAHAQPRLWTGVALVGALRVYSLPASRDGLVGLVLVAAPLGEVTATLRTLLLVLVGGGLAVATLAVLGSGLLIRRGLWALDEMARVAESINAQRLDQRLNLRNPPREVARLAHTFDGMLDRLHEAVAAQRRFVADASHELRTPLAIIWGRSEVLLLSQALTAQTREGLELVRDEAGRMGRLVANLLLLARGDEGRALNRQPVALDVLLLEVARQAHGLAPKVHLRIVREDQAQVLGDADLLKQVLLNLLENAFTHTSPGGQVAISLAVVDGWARLAVRDSGPGIAPAELTRIFERFYRVDKGRSRAEGGAGLGLAIARWIAEAHGGRIEVESRVGHGSAFTMVLPISDHSLTIS